MDFIKSLEWRYATKKMNGTPVTEEKVATILKAIQLAPSSYGLQPFSVFVITDPELKKQIQPIAYNQSQVVDSSHLLVFAAWSSVSAAQIDAYIENTAATRNMPVEGLAEFKNMLVGSITPRSDEQNFQWAARQAYIALGFGLAAAAVEGVDSTPMEGFNAEGLDELLQLKEKGLKSVTLLALGHRDAEHDYLASMKKVRRGEDTFFIKK
jgi:nitroreductase